MIPFAVRRVGGLLVTLLLIATVSFFLLRLAPGGPFDADREVDAAVRAAQEARYRLDRSLPAQYAGWLADLLRGDLGPSSCYPGLTVNEVLAAAIPPSFLLGGLALGIALVLGVLAGALAGRHPGGLADRAVSMFALLFISIPSFVLGAALLLLFSLHLRWFPAGLLEGAASLVLPVLTLGLPMAAVIARLARSGLAETMGEDWIRTARSKGISETRVVLVHGLRTALLPVVSFLGPAAAGVLTGSVVVERIFALPGLGTHFVNSALNRDYSLVMGTVLVYSALLVTLNFLSDLALAALDPRARTR
ncbi:MAG: ABC transporter permease [Planctomycetes bacterium]|jgi:oligopeptide transport system permease protein|nr:ABC transporter permease [Planctomycetota bacterium]